MSAAPRGPEPEPASGTGRALPPLLRRLFERQLDADLREVRVHDDHAARRQADDEGAEGFAVGNDVVLGSTAAGDGRSQAELLRHEVGHVAQQNQPGAGRLRQRQPSQGQGLGRTAPAGSYETAEGQAPEDGHVLFSRDRADLDRADRATLRSLVSGVNGATTIHVHGYASQEGDDEYNLNLAAHRAMRVKEHLETLLPKEARVLAFARGETSDFGQGPQNRRVGVDIIESEPAGLLSETPAAAPTPDLNLNPRRYSLLDRPLELRDPTPDFLPDLDQIQEPARGPLRLEPFDPSDLGRSFAMRGLRFDDRDAAAAGAMYRQWRDTYIRWGLNHEQAAWLSQLGTEKALERQLLLENPTESEAFDLRHQTEPTMIYVDLFWVMRKLRED